MSRLASGAEFGSGRRWVLPQRFLSCRFFRSEAALDALRSHIAAARAAGASCNLALYNYPSFAGAYAALFSHLFHSRLRIPFLALPFSSIEPFRVEDLKLRGIHTCYLLDFIGPKGFCIELARFIPRVIAFDHHKSAEARVAEFGERPVNLELHVDTNKSCASAAYDYFSQMITGAKQEAGIGLLSNENESQINVILRHMEDIDLHRYNLPGNEAFTIGLMNERAKLNSVTNPHVFEQLLHIDSAKLIDRGNSYITSRCNSAKELIRKPFMVQLGKGVYGECLGIRADGNSDLSHEIAIELSKMSVEAGLRPIGAVIFMQRGNLKMCLRSTDKGTDVSEIAKAYGGGGTRSSSSFIIRMDEYNHWTSMNQSRVK